MRLLASFLLIGLTLQTAPPQTRTLTGTVVDPAGSPIAGVEIELRQRESILRRTVSDRAGTWKIENVSPGDYTVRHRLAGFVTTDLRLSVSTADSQVKAVLKVGVVSETVEVIGATRDASGEVQIMLSGGGVPGGVVGGVVGGVPAAPPPPAAAPVRVGGAIGPRDIVPDYVRDTSIRDAAPRMTPDLGFAAAVAEFGMLLRRSDFLSEATWGQALELAREHRGSDSDGYRGEFVRLVELAAALEP